MIGLVVDCAQAECELSFTKATHNQKYCSNECCRIETKRKSMEKYYERVAIKRGKKRKCETCDTTLSRYNEGKRCGACETEKKNENVGEASALVGSVSWL